MGVVNGIEGIDSFHLIAFAADGIERLPHRQAVVQFHKLHRHQASGGILGIFQKFGNALTGFFVHVAQHFFDNVCGNLFEKVHRIVQAKLVGQARNFAVGNGFDNGLLHLGGQIGKRIRRQILGKHPEHQQALFRVKVFEEGGNVRCIHAAKALLQRRDLVLFHQGYELLKLLHGIRSFLRCPDALFVFTVFLHDKNTRPRKNPIARGRIKAGSATSYRRQRGFVGRPIRTRPLRLRGSGMFSPAPHLSFPSIQVTSVLQYKIEGMSALFRTHPMVCRQTIFVNPTRAISLIFTFS